ALVSSHDLFPAYRVGNAVRLAERHHLPDAGNRYPRFHRSGLVVKAAVQHAAVVSGLMLGDSVLFFEHRDARPREPLAQPVGSGQANDAAANDDNFWGVHKNTIASVVCRGCQDFSQLIAKILTQPFKGLPGPGLRSLPGTPASPHISNGSLELLRP